MTRELIKEKLDLVLNQILGKAKHGWKNSTKLNSLSISEFNREEICSEVGVIFGIDYPTKESVFKGTINDLMDFIESKFERG